MRRKSISRDWKQCAPKRAGHFVPGLLIGTAVGVIAMAALWYTGPKRTYDRVVDELGQGMIENALRLESCTAAYVKSHGGVLPKGTLVLGKGQALIVIGYDPEGKK